MCVCPSIVKSLLYVDCTETLLKETFLCPVGSKENRMKP